MKLATVAAAMLCGAVQASEPDLLTFDRIAYELAVLDLVEHELELAEPVADRPTVEPAPGKVPRFNPCAHLPPDEPSGVCHCPPAPASAWPKCADRPPTHRCCRTTISSTCCWPKTR